MTKDELKKLDNIAAQLPTSWESMKFSDYNKCMNVPITEAVDDEDDQRFSSVNNSYKILSALTGEPFKYFEYIPYANIVPLIQKINFMFTEPKAGEFKHTKKVKKMEEVTYNEFVEFLQLFKDPVNNMAKIVALFTYKQDGSKYTEEDVNNFSVAEVYSIFFTLNKLSQKSIKLFRKRALIQLMKLAIKGIIKYLIILFKQKTGRLKKG